MAGDTIKKEINVEMEQLGSGDLGAIKVKRAFWLKLKKEVNFAVQTCTLVILKLDFHFYKSTHDDQIIYPLLRLFPFSFFTLSLRVL